MADFVLLPCKLISAFVEDVAGYIEAKQEARCRQQCGKRLKSQLKHANSLTLLGGLMTVLGLIKDNNILFFKTFYSKLLAI